MTKQISSRRSSVSSTVHGSTPAATEDSCVRKLGHKKLVSVTNHHHTMSSSRGLKESEPEPRLPNSGPTSSTKQASLSSSHSSVAQCAPFYSTSPGSTDMFSASPSRHYGVRNNHYPANSGMREDTRLAPSLALQTLPSQCTSTSSRRSSLRRSSTTVILNTQPSHATSQFDEVGKTKSLKESPSVRERQHQEEMEALKNYGAGLEVDDQAIDDWDETV
ncbi:hypothetical protein SeLEV6574_g01957 [Synchytrium endobioticum]|nr:hypothetical protein SeLEV6574_g01957 [Synchytrium endobioticum]